MDTYEELVGVKTRFENSTETELFRYLSCFENKWILHNNKNINNIVTKAVENFGLQDNFTFDEVNTNYKKCLYNVVYLQIELGNKLTSDDREDEYQEVQTKFFKIFESIDYCSNSNHCCDRCFQDYVSNQCQSCTLDIISCTE